MHLETATLQQATLPEVRARALLAGVLPPLAQNRRCISRQPGGLSVHEHLPWLAAPGAARRRPSSGGGTSINRHATTRQHGG